MKKQSKQPAANSTLYFFGEINNQSALSFIMGLNEADSKDGLITVIFCSEGGEVDSAIAMYDAIKSTTNEVLAMGTGLVASAAILPFLACDARLMQPNAKLFFHEVSAVSPSAGPMAKSASELVKMSEELQKISGVYVDLVSKNCKLDGDFIQKICEEETLVDVQQALEWGMVDGEYSHTKKKKKHKSQLANAIQPLILAKMEKIK